METKIDYSSQHGFRYSSKKGKLYNFDISILPQVGERKSHGIHPIGNFLVKFAQLDTKKFFSYEIRLTLVAINELGARGPEDLKFKSIKVATELLEQGCDDDMLVIITHADEYIAQTSELPLQKHWLYYQKRESDFLSQSQRGNPDPGIAFQAPKKGEYCLGD